MFWTALLLAALVGPALAGASVTIFYDKVGRVTGSARTEYGRTTLYDSSGRHIQRFTSCELEKAVDPIAH
jgi:hypothetical protein